MPANTAHLFKRLLAVKNLRLKSFVKIRCRDSFIPFAKWLLGERIFLKEACVLCGQCAALCPNKAITLGAGEIRFDEKLCVGCCGCLNICPQNAWRSATRQKNAETIAPALKTGAVRPAKRVAAAPAD